MAATVGSVWATAFPRERLRVIVAVDGGDERVAAAAAAAGAEVVVVSPNQGSYAARNAAADAAGAVDVLLFTDVDCVVSPMWIDAHLAALSDDSLSGGGVRFVFSGPRPNPAEWVDSQRHLKQELYVRHDGFAATCNLAVRRDAFDAVRFDSSLRTGGDADFCLRARAAGYGLVYTANAAVEHPARATRKEVLAKVRRIAGAAPRVRELQGRAADAPRSRLTLGAYRKAREAGLRVGPLWGIRACLLDYAAQRIVRDEYRRQRHS